MATNHDGHKQTGNVHSIHITSVLPSWFVAVIVEPQSTEGLRTESLQVARPATEPACLHHDTGSLYLSVTPKFYTKPKIQLLNSGVKPCLGLKSIWFYTELKL